MRKRLKNFLIAAILISLIPIFGIFFYFYIFQNSAFEVKQRFAAPNILTEPIEEEGSLIPNGGIERPKPLANPPPIIKAVYLTGWSAGMESRINYLVDLADTTEINAVVIDVKDFSGYLAYDTSVAEAEKYKSEEIKIPDIDALMEKLHEKEIYAIARIVVFQDPVLAGARPDLAVQNKIKLSRVKTASVSTLWYDDKGLAWIDPAAKEAWDYTVAIAKDAADHGFDELNFDYIRFPSDGNLANMAFLFWDGVVPRYGIIRNFLGYLRQELPNIKISIDFFGLSTINTNDLNIGQIIEDAYEYADFVSPMVYPSHYFSGFLGYKNPAVYPYEVVRYSIDRALARLLTFSENRAEARDVKLRPWIQDFDLGAIYDAKAVRAQIQAVHDSLGDEFAGFMLWNPSNVYTKEALVSF